MVEDDRYCIDVLDQVAAVTRALQGVALRAARRAPGPLRGRGHRRRGRARRTAKLAEASAAIARLVRS